MSRRGWRWGLGPVAELLRWCQFAPSGADRSRCGLSHDQVDDSFQSSRGLTARGWPLVWRTLIRLGLGAGLAERVFDLVRVNSSRRMMLRMTWCSFCVRTLTVRSLPAEIRDVSCFTICFDGLLRCSFEGVSHERRLRSRYSLNAFVC